MFKHLQTEGTLTRLIINSSELPFWNISETQERTPGLRYERNQPLNQPIPWNHVTNQVWTRVLSPRRWKTVNQIINENRRHLPSGIFLRQFASAANNKRAAFLPASKETKRRSKGGSWGLVFTHELHSPMKEETSIPRALTRTHTRAPGPRSLGRALFGGENRSV